MTTKEKVSLFFNSILEEVEKIENKEIRDKALMGLLQQVEFQLTNIKTFIKENK